MGIGRSEGVTLMLCLQFSQKGSNLAPALTALNSKEVLPFLRLAAESKPLDGLDFAVKYPTGSSKRTSHLEHE